VTSLPLETGEGGKSESLVLRCTMFICSAIKLGGMRPPGFHPSTTKQIGKNFKDINAIKVEKTKTEQHTHTKSSYCSNPSFSTSTTEFAWGAQPLPFSWNQISSQCPSRPLPPSCREKAPHSCSTSHRNVDSSPPRLGPEFPLFKSCLS
jgi:hypothetical protein